MIGGYRGDDSRAQTFEMSHTHQGQSRSLSAANLGHQFSNHVGDCEVEDVGVDPRHGIFGEAVAKAHESFYRQNEPR